MINQSPLVERARELLKDVPREPLLSSAEVQQFDLGESIRIVTAANRHKAVAVVMNFDDYPEANEGDAEDYDIAAQAYARLFAAAPDLVEGLCKENEALRALLVRVERWFSERNILGGEAPFLVADIRAALTQPGILTK